MLVLFQFVSVRIALGFYEYSAGRTVALASSAVQDKKSSSATAVNSKVGAPMRLSIPRIRVNAVITSVGLMPDGSMGVPKLPLETAWYMLGPKPGEKGSAAIAGHIDWWYGAKGVFERLNVLKPGDLITVQDDQGTLTSFVVRKTRTYGHKEDASDVFRSSDGKSHLNLITCDGVWNRITRMYSKRLVVFADKVGE